MVNVVFSNLAIGNRYFGKSPEEDLPKLACFLNAAVLLGKVFVAVDTARDKTNAIEYVKKHYPDVDVFAVTPWGHYIRPLNVILDKAELFGATQVLFASTEFPPKESDVAILRSYFDGKTLVVGARLDAHDFSEDFVIGNGARVPWDTFALWNLKLFFDGFSRVSDAAFDQGVSSGVEEVIAITKHQILLGSPKNAQAKVIQIPNFHGRWEEGSLVGDSTAAHEAKIAKKIPRPAKQLVHSGLSEPIVDHIIHRP